MRHADTQVREGGPTNVESAREDMHMSVTCNANRESSSDVSSATSPQRRDVTARQSAHVTRRRLAASITVRPLKSPGASAAIQRHSSVLRREASCRGLDLLAGVFASQCNFGHIRLLPEHARNAASPIPCHTSAPTRRPPDRSPAGLRRSSSGSTLDTTAHRFRHRLWWLSAAIAGRLWAEQPVSCEPPSARRRSIPSALRHLRWRRLWRRAIEPQSACGTCSVCCMAALEQTELVALQKQLQL